MWTIKQKDKSKTKGYGIRNETIIRQITSLKMRFQVFMALRSWMYFLGSNPENGCSKFLWNAGNDIQYYTVLKARISQ